MEKQYLFTELLARDTGQKLYDHTKEVLEYSLELYKEGGLLEDLRAAAILHDIAKAQEVYQRLYRGEKIGKREHAVASAWIGRCLEKNNITCVATRLVESHHKGLAQSEDIYAKITAIRDAVDALEVLLTLEDPIYELLRLIGVDRENLENAKRKLKTILMLAESICKKNDDVRELEPILLECERDGRERPLGLFIEVRRALGALVVADSLSASGFTPSDLQVPRKNLPPEKIRAVLSQKRKNKKIDTVREYIARKVEEFARGVDLNQKIFTMALPTGAGKTFHSLRFAIILRERIEKELKQDPPRIFYVLPFTTIIDQTYERFTKIYGENVEKRHYLTDEKPVEEVPENLQDIVRLLYPSEITVTTYVQFYSALVGNSRRDAIRALGLRNRIIILDEVQSIPYEHWEIIKEFIKVLARENWILMMSATVPKFVVPESTVKIIDVNNVPQREVFKRHRFVRQKFSEYRDVVKEAIERYLKGESVAIVANTVRAAEAMYTEAKEILEKKGIKLSVSEAGAHHGDGAVIYLSTFVPPFARKLRLKAFDSHVLAITTQVIEAGVDVSVDVLYRELAPLDSIIQAAGRCNRNGEREVGDVIIFETEETRERFNNVYGLALYTATTSALSDVEEFTDEEVDNLLKRYYESLKLTGKDDALKKSVERSVKNCSFVADIKAIESVPKEPVVVLYPKAQTLLKSLAEHYEKGAGKKVISRLLRDLGQYIVNVYPKQTNRFEQVSTGPLSFYAVKPNDENNYVRDIGVLYNPKTDPLAFEDRLA